MVKPDTLRIIVETTTPDGVRHAREAVYSIQLLDALSESARGWIWDEVQELRDRFPKEVDEYYAAIT